jgi:hypothetical protein
MGRSRARGATQLQDGYALLLVMFTVALLVITLAAVRPNIITEDRREKEVEMIWRGKQYVRGIRLYYQKWHHFPTQLDDLYTPKTGFRFMRQAYRDPMNTADGTWRLIYVGPTGQIIGSLTQPTNPLLSGANPANGAYGILPASATSSIGGTKSPFSASIGTSGPSSSSGTPTGCQTSSSSPANPLETPIGGSLPSTQASQCSNTPQPQPAVDPPDPNPVPAVNAIIGVGSKINRRSIMWREGEKNYLHFEFIWKIELPNPNTVTPNP